MTYNIKFINGAKLIAIGVIGNLLSVAIPIYFKRNFNLDINLMVFLIISGILFSYALGYLTSKCNLTFRIEQNGLYTEKFGIVKWTNIKSIRIENTFDYENLIIEFEISNKITIPCKIEENINRKQFIDFKNEISNRVLNTENQQAGIIQNSYIYDGKGYKFLGYILILSTIIVTIYSIYSWLIGDFSGKKITSLILVYSSSLTFLPRIFRDSILNKM